MEGTWTLEPLVNRNAQLGVNASVWCGPHQVSANKSYSTQRFTILEPTEHRNNLYLSLVVSSWAKDIPYCWRLKYLSVLNQALTFPSETHLIPLESHL